MDLLLQAERLGAARVVLWTDPPSGLRAVLVIDDLTLGPAAGGVRTKRYGSTADALCDAARLARAMTLKCSVTGMDAGGAKTVVIDHDGLDRPRAFEELGRRIEELGGLYHAAGDLGTTIDDQLAIGRTTRFMHGLDGELAPPVGRGLLRCLEACAEARGRSTLAGLRVAIQGCGAMGVAVARALSEAGIELLVADIDTARAEALAAEVRCQVAPPDEIFRADVDVISPCAVGGVLTAEVVAGLRAWAVCGAANNILATDDVACALAERGVLFVPDFISSAGAVVDGIGRIVMGRTDAAPLVDDLGNIALQVLEAARATGRTTLEIARQRAMDRIAKARAAKSAQS